MKDKIKKMVGRLMGFINRKTQKTPRLRRLLIKINNNFTIVKNRNLMIYDTRKTTKKVVLKPFNQLKVAVILDEFSYNSFKDDFECIVISPDNWEKTFKHEKPDIFLCESAWSGIDSEIRPWKGKIYSSVNFNSENRLVLFNILKYCRQNKIPTVFWNKEDPSHYEDKVHNFADTAVKFDHVFTTAEECVELYTRQYGHKSVHSLMFATNPKLFNPIKEYERTNELIFAGSWYSYLEQRCIDIEKILDGAIEQNIDIVIYDRYYNYKDDENHVWPEKYRKFIRPALEYTEISKAYKGSNFALNFTSVTESKTMFARRVFELMSCRTCIVSNYSVGVEKLLGDNVIFAGENMELVFDNKKIEENLYSALREHTYKHRFRQILEAIKYPYLDIKEDITLYYIMDKEEDFEEAIQIFERFTASNIKYTFLLSSNIENTAVKDLYQRYNSADVAVISMDYYSKYDSFECNTKYFIFMDASNKIDCEFIEKSILHFSYINENTGICRASDEAEKYTFKVISNAFNTLYSASKLPDILADCNAEQKVYLI